VGRVSANYQTTSMVLSFLMRVSALTSFA
jgi:hypothetical protein